jgi:hypothetical protein
LTDRLQGGPVPPVQPVSPQPVHAPTGQMPMPSWGPPPAAPERAGLAGGLKQKGGELVRVVRDWPRRLQLGAAGGLAVVLILVAFFALRGGGDPPAGPSLQAGAPSGAPSAAAFPTQVHSERGVSVNVPDGWKRSGGGKSVYFDYVDPDDAGRKVRILVEQTSAKATPTGFLQTAERGLKGNAKSCPKPYARVDLQEGEIGGRVSGVLEYTCGEGGTERHGVWGAVVDGGHAYSFFMTSTEERFADSKPIFDEMVRSFKLSATG